ncbi:MAG: phosphoribosylamine--glycine ligase [Acidobacteriota bacterium]
MNILVVGSGGREHAIAWRCAAEGHKVWTAPGNPGIAAVAECVPLESQTPERYLEVANLINADLTIVGPEAPLVAGIVDLFESHGRKVFGPRREAAQLEGSKAFSKEFMARHGIPTARFQIFDSLAEARAALVRFELPVVLKADGLAAGKGVVIAKTRAEAEAAIEGLFSGDLVGAAGSRVIIEDFWRGEEVSFIAICDQDRARALPPSQDHKAIFENDEGPNTGGMGAYSDDRILSGEQKEWILNNVILRTLEGMAAEGMPFRGFLYAGLMMTADGPKVLEYNVRLGDPETQALLYRMEGGFAETILAATEGRLDSARLRIGAGASACVVLAAAGYPGKVRSGDVIEGLDEVEGATVFHAGTRREGDRIVTAGGRVLGVTGRGESLRAALDAVYGAVRPIRFEGMQYRRDIGQKGLKRYTD